jgi:chromosomal replication initiation ATPase DnaA
MRPGPVQMKFHADHKDALRRLYRAGDHLAALEAAKESAAREPLHQALRQAQQEASELRAELAEAKAAIRNSSPLPLPMFADVVARAHMIDAADIMARRRAKPIVYARFHLIAVFMERKPKWSFPMLGRAFGQDHTTIINARDRWQEIKHNFSREIAEVNAEIGPRPEACAWER